MIEIKIVPNKVTSGTNGLNNSMIKMPQVNRANGIRKPTINRNPLKANGVSKLKMYLKLIRVSGGNNLIFNNKPAKANMLKATISHRPVKANGDNKPTDSHKPVKLSIIKVIVNHKLIRTSGVNKLTTKLKLIKPNGVKVLIMSSKLVKVTGISPVLNNKIGTKHPKMTYSTILKVHRHQNMHRAMNSQVCVYISYSPYMSN